MVVDMARNTPAQPSHSELSFPFERYHLANGVRVLLQRDERSPIVSLQTWCRGGSAMDPNGKTGIAHLFEHLMFTGTVAVPDGELDRRIESLGGRINAATWLDWTYYYVDAPSNALVEVMELEADRYQGLVLESDRVETEREVVLNERRECIDNDPDGQLSEALWAKAFKGHPYGNPTIGWAQDIRAISLDDCRDHYARWYAADQTIITITGLFDTDDVLRHVERLFGSLKPSQQDVSVSSHTIKPASQAQRISLPIAGERVLMGFVGPPTLDPDHAALDVLNQILMEGESARLFKALINDLELAAAAFGFIPTLQCASLYELGADLRPGESSQRVIDTIHSTLDDIMKNGPTPKELEKARNRLETRLFSNLQTAQQRAQALGYWEVLDTAESMMSRALRLRSVGVEDVMSAAQRYLKPELGYVIIGCPETA